MIGIRRRNGYASKRGGGTTAWTPGGSATTGVVALISVLALTACRTDRAAKVMESTRVQPVPAFAAPPLTKAEAHRDRSIPDRIRRDAYGRAIYFREVPMDRHGAAACGGKGCEPVVDQRRDGE